MGEKRLKTTKNKTSEQQGLKHRNTKREHKPSVSITRPTVQTVSRRSTPFLRSAALRVRRCIIPFYRHENESRDCPKGQRSTRSRRDSNPAGRPRSPPSPLPPLCLAKVTSATMPSFSQEVVLLSATGSEASFTTLERFLYTTST